MASFPIDFAHAQAPIRPRGAAFGALALALGMIAVASVFMHHRDLLSQIDALEQDVARAGASAGPARTVTAQETAALAERIRGANRAAADLTLPWDAVLGAIESATDKSTALLDLRVDLVKRDIRITGDADDFPALQAYIGRLAAGEVLVDVRLLSHEQSSQSSPVRFELHAGWAGRS